MKYRRVRKAIAGVFCGIFLTGAALICTGILVLFCAVDGAGQGDSLNLFGFTVFLSGDGAPVGEYSPGTAIVVQDTPHDLLNPGDPIICRDLDTENRFYPVVRYVASYDPAYPSTVTAVSIGDWEILTVNRDDIIGKCIFSSAALGRMLELAQSDEQGPVLLVLILGGLAFLFAVCLLWYLYLGRGQTKKVVESQRDEPFDLFGMIELEDAPLEWVEPSAVLKGPAGPEEEATEIDGLSSSKFSL